MGSPAATVGAECQPQHEERQAQRRADQLAPVEVPDPHRAPNPRRSQQIVFAEGERLDVSWVLRPRATGSAQKRADPLFGPDVPDPDAATFPRHRQPTPVG